MIVFLNLINSVLEIVVSFMSYEQALKKKESQIPPSPERVLIREMASCRDYNNKVVSDIEFYVNSSNRIRASLEVQNIRLLNCIKKLEDCNDLVRDCGLEGVRDVASIEKEEECRLVARGHQRRLKKLITDYNMLLNLSQEKNNSIDKCREELFSCEQDYIFCNKYHERNYTR